MKKANVKSWRMFGRALVICVLLALFTAGMLTGCSGGSGSGSGAADGGDITLVIPSFFFAHGDTFETWMTWVCDKFEEDNPGVKLERMSVSYDGYWEKIDSMIAANTAPDVFWSDTQNAGKYISAKAYEPLNNLIDMDDINANYSDAQTKYMPMLADDGLTYVLINNWVPYAPLYVTTTMKEIGVDKYPTNREEWLAAAQKAVDAGKYWNSIITQVGNYEEGGHDLRMWTTGLGGTFSDGNGNPTYNNPVTREVFSILKATYDLGAIPNDTGSDGQKKMMAVGDVVTLWDGAYTIGILKGYNPDFTDDMVGWSWGLSKGIMPGGANLVGVASQSKHKQAAADFVMAMNSLESSKVMFRETYVATPRTDLINDTEFINSLKADLPWIEDFFNITADAVFYQPFDLPAENLDESIRILYSHFERVLYDNADIDTELDACQAEVEALFKS